MEAFEETGIWWTPDDEAKKVPGILRFAQPDGLELQLIGALGTGIQLVDEPYPAILGFAEKLGEVTLEDCRPAGIRINVPGIRCETYRPSIAYMGAHFPDPSAATFVKARLAFNHLPDWVQQSGIAVMFPRDPAAQTPLKMEYTHPVTRKAFTEAGSVSINFAASTHGDLLREFAIQQNLTLDVEPRAPLPLEDIYMTFVTPLQSLLTFGTGEANVLRSLTLFTPDQIIKLRNGQTRRVPIKVYFKSRDAAETHEGRLFPHDMLFTLQDIADRFQDVIANWLRLSSEVESAVALFTNTYFAPKMHSDRVFLALAQAAETYHRTRFVTTQITQKKFQVREKRILAVCPHELKSWLAAGLKHMNSPPFKQRLEELVQASGECVRPLAGTTPKFIRKVVDTRNYYTHYSKDLRGRAARGIGLSLLAQKLSVLVRSCLLAELGIPSTERRKLFRRNQNYLYLLRESPAGMDRDLFTAANAAKRDCTIVRAYQSGKYTQAEIGSLVGIHASTVSHILKRSRGESELSSCAD